MKVFQSPSPSPARLCAYDQDKICIREMRGLKVPPNIDRVWHSPWPSGPSIKIVLIKFKFAPPCARHFKIAGLRGQLWIMLAFLYALHQHQRRLKIFHDVGTDCRQRLLHAIRG